MIPSVARHLICPLHERLLRRPTFRFARQLEESQWYAPDELRAVQRDKLRDLLRHAGSNTSFYRRRFDQAGVNVDRLEPKEVLKRLPLLDKPTIRAAGEELLWRSAPGGLFPHNTGGSTGEPLVFYFGRRRQAFDQAARIRTHRWYGVDIGDRELYLWGSPIELGSGGRLKMARDALFNHRLLNAFDMSPDRMDAYIRTLHRFQPACLFGYPSSLALLAEHARARGRQLSTAGLRAVFVTGEVCHPHQRKTIASAFGVDVADGYGSREAGFIAHQCPQGNMHLTAENIFVEIIDGQGSVLPPGHTGEIVVTHLDAYAMPFIRYRTGDVGRLRPGRCSCGRGLPMMDVVQGRTTDFLYLPDGTVMHALSIIYPLREMTGIRQFRVTQNEDFSVLVDVVADNRIERLTREAVAQRVRPVLGGQVDLQVSLVDGISPSHSGKHRYVVSRVQRKTDRSPEEVGPGG